MRKTTESEYYPADYFVIKGIPIIQPTLIATMHVYDKYTPNAFDKFQKHKLPFVELFSF
jgi:hypothetical protein